MKKVLLILICSLGLAACGQKGPLVPPVQADTYSIAGQ
jgi:predicted small lipoprotein YifL